MSPDTAYQFLYTAALIVFAVLIGIMLVRAAIGPRITDRIMSVNMMGTMVISSIAVLSRMLKEGYLVDIALIYAMISFVAVLMLATAYLPADPSRPDLHRRKIEFRSKKGRKQEGSETEGRRKP